MRVLYVDDDRINSLLFVEACRLVGGVQTETASSGVEALELAQRWRPDFLVIDLHLPDTNGCALLPALREALGAPRLPAFLCTAEETTTAAAAAQSAGFDGCWSKPVDLQAVLTELTRRSGAAPAT